MDTHYINPHSTHILVRHNEISLKGKNRPFFEKRLRQNLSRIIGNQGSVKKYSDRTLIEVTNKTTTDFYKIINKVTQLGGIISVSPCRLLEPQLEKLEETALQWAQADFERNPSIQTFAVRTRRTNKQFPTRSNEVDRQIGTKIRALKPELTTNLKHPDFKLSIEIRDNHALIYSSQNNGICGLPLNKYERVLCLLSGGIDSPVAAHEIMKRGCVPIFIHFHSKPYTSEKSYLKVRRLANKIREFSPYPLEFWSVPLIHIQKTVKDACNERYRTVHYRRFMMRIAEELASRVGAKALVTGDALGQVASQTLSNMLAIEEVTKIPVLRPLVSLDKAQIIEKSKALGTFDISIEPHDDACILFAPGNPATQASASHLAEEDQSLDLYKLVFDAVDQAEKELL